MLPGERASNTSPRFSLSGAMIPRGSSSFGIEGPVPLTILTIFKKYSILNKPSISNSPLLLHPQFLSVRRCAAFQKSHPRKNPQNIPFSPCLLHHWWWKRRKLSLILLFAASPTDQVCPHQFQNIPFQPMNIGLRLFWYLEMFKCLPYLQSLFQFFPEMIRSNWERFLRSLGTCIRIVEVKIPK